MNHAAYFVVRTAMTCVVIMVIVSATSRVQGQVDYETRVLSGDATGIAPGVSFSDFDIPVINGSGQIAFQAILAGTGVSGANDSGIFSEAAGSIGSPGLIAREGDAVPGAGSGVNYSQFSGPAFNDAGQTAYIAEFFGLGVNSNNDFGILSEAAGSIGSPSLIAREDDAAPGTALGVNYDSLFVPVLNDLGQTAFVASLTSTSNDSGIFSESAGSIGNPGLVALEDNVAPGTGPGVRYNGFLPPVLNGAGQTAFIARLTGPGVNAANDSGLFSEGAGSIGNPGLVARTGDAAPGTAPGVNYESFESNRPTLNDAGQTAFRAGLTGVGVNGTNNSGIYSETAGPIGSPGLIARTGNAAPDTDTGVRYSFLRNPSLNGAGQIVFIANLTGPGVNSSNDSGIFTDVGGTIGSVGLIVRTGDAAPGTGPGINFGFLGGGPLFNGVGQIAFTAELTGTGVDTTNDVGIWATDLDGLLTLIVREGDLFDVNDDPEHRRFAYCRVFRNQLWRRQRERPPLVL